MDEVNYEIQKTEKNGNIRLFCILNSKLAVAELNNLENISDWLENNRVINHNSWMFFNCINDPNSISNKGVGTAMMENGYLYRSKKI